MAGNWKVLEKEGIINRVTNPSLETNTTSWANAGMATFARSSTFAFFGAWSLHMIANSQNDLGFIDVSGFTAAATVTGSVWVKANSSSVELLLSSQPGATDLDSDAHSGSGGWERLVVSGPLDAGESIARLRVIDRRAAGWDDIYVDGAQCEEESAVTIYCDGDQPGCEWLGTEHGSLSQRSASALSGGVAREFEDDYSFFVDRMVGTGAAQIDVAMDEYATLDGGELNSRDRPPREFVLGGTITGTTLANLHANRQSLLNVLKPRAPGRQPIRLRYDGAAVEKFADAFYAGGLDSGIMAETARINAKEQVQIRFIAPDPNWYEIGESADVLDVADAPTLRYVSARLRSTGQWDDVGINANPFAGGDVLAICVASNGIVYIGGDWTDFRGDAGDGSYIAKYDPLADDWTALSTSVNDVVRAIVEGPDGTIYIGGEFTNAGGLGADADYIVSYDYATDTFDEVEAGAVPTGDVLALAFGLDGTLYIGGDFANFDGLGANGNRIVSWTAVGGYAAVGAGGMNGLVNRIAVGPDGVVYVVGGFTDAGGTAANRIASWDGTAWSALGTGLDALTLGVAVDKRNIVYAAGEFSNAGGESARAVAKWNGTAWEALGSSTALNNDAEVVTIGPDGMIYVGGDFTAAGDITFADRVAKWNGANWAALDVDLFGTPIVQAIAVGPPDPIVGANYDLWIGFTTTGVSVSAGTSTATDDGTEISFPRLILESTGGTGRIYQVRNETTGRELNFNYNLLDGESLTIFLDPRDKRIISSFSGSRQDALLNQSALGQFSLAPGANQITALVVATGGTASATAIWRDSYDGVD